MADNVAYTPGSGATVAADDIGGVLHQRIKISQGAPDAATDVSPVAPLSILPGHPATKTLTTASVSTASSGQTALVSATSAQTTRMFSLFLVFEGATTVKFQDGSTDLTGAMQMQAGGTIALDFTGEPYWVGTANTAFNISLGSAVGCRGWVQYEKTA